MTNLKTTDIKGKPYVEVHERLRYFRGNYPKHALVTRIHELTPEYCIIVAEIITEEGRVMASGIAREVNGDSFINKTSYVENCETSAWGRALGCFGIGISNSVASAEEVTNAILNQSAQKPPVTSKDEAKANMIVEQAWFEYETVHKSDVPDFWRLDKDKFIAAIKAKFGKLPTRKESVAKICDETTGVRLEDVMVEDNV